MKKSQHFYDVQNNVGSKVGKPYFGTREVKCSVGSCKHFYGVQNEKGNSVGKRYKKAYK